MNWREAVARSDGSVYRARKRPSVHAYEDGYDSGGVIVARTHDVDVALALATEEYLSMYDGPMPAPHVCWQRLVPWDTVGGGFDSSWETVPDTTRGAIPCVVFAAD